MQEDTLQQKKRLGRIIDDRGEKARRALELGGYVKEGGKIDEAVVIDFLVDLLHVVVPEITESGGRWLPITRFAHEQFQRERDSR